MNSLLYPTIAVDIMSLLVCIAVLYANVFEVRIKSLKNQAFTNACILCIVGLVSDIIAWSCEGKPAYTWLLYPSITIGNAVSYLLIAVFIMYVSCYMREKGTEPHKFLRNFTIFCVVCFSLTVIAPMFGLMFHIEDGFVVYTELFSLYAIFTAGCFGIGIAVICYARPTIGLHNAVATGLFLAFPCDAAIVSFIWNDISFAYAAVTLSIVVVYVMVQAESVDDIEKEKQISNYYAHHDELTGLLSRRAFNERMDDLKTKKVNTGVIFLDMNGLKITNDTKGHIAGDNLLVNFSRILESVYRKEDIFRIGGDEFVVIIEDIDQDTFKARQKDLEEKIVTDGAPLACYGTKFGKSCDIEDMVRVAEAGMYKDKIEVHKKYPELNR